MIQRNEVRLLSADEHEHDLNPDKVLQIFGLSKSIRDKLDPGIQQWVAVLDTSPFQETYWAPTHSTGSLDPAESRLNANERLKRVNKYFKLKAADVLSDDLSVRLLAKLYEAESIEFPELDIDDASRALAKLTAAGFCDLGELKLQITDSGRQFIEGIEKS